MAREQQLAEVFVELADTLVADFDLMEFLHLLTERCVEHLPMDAAGILLTDQQDHLQLVAASSEDVRLLELFQVQSRQGPCVDCFRTGQALICDDLSRYRDRWPDFTDAARERGFDAVHALPMRLRHKVIGTLNLFSTTADGLQTGIQGVAQAFADVATIGILGERASREQQLLAQQLQIALNTRIVLEQAKGLLAGRHGLSMEEAFTALRGAARRNSRKMHEVARAVINGDDIIGDPGPNP